MTTSICLADDSESTPVASRETNAPSRQVVTVIEPKPGWRAIDLGELWRYRELMYCLTLRDIQVRYKQTVLGATWAIIQPLLTSVVFVILFGVMGRMREDTILPYLALVFAGQMAWQFFATAITQCGQSLISSANLISKVYFPRLIIPISAVGSGLVDFFVAAVMMGIILAAYGLAPPLQIVLLPFMLLGVTVSALGIGALFAALTVAYRDFRYVVPFCVQMWMFATPVGYPLEKVIDTLAGRGYSDWWLAPYFCNPMAGYVQGFRWCLFGEPLHPFYFSLSVTVSLLLLFVVAVYFRRMERRFADIV